MPMIRAAVILLLVALGTGCRADEVPADTTSGPFSAPTDTTTVEALGLLYGRVTTYGGAVYEGRLRWGGDEEAFWTDTFDGVKDRNPWVEHTPLQQRTPARFFGIEIAWGDAGVDLSRPFMARFGDIARIEAVGDGVRGVVEDGAGFDPDVRVTLKSGTTFDLDRLEASDFDDGVRVWDVGGVVDLGPGDIRRIEFLPTPRLGGVPTQIFGTVQTTEGAFTGFVEWGRGASLGSDRLVGASGEGGVPFDSVRSVVRDGGGLVMVRQDGQEVTLSQRPHASPVLTVFVGTSRRVRVSWDAFERLDLSDRSPRGHAYHHFRPGHPLVGSVETRDGRRLGGRIVFDLDESETTETLDAPAGGLDHSIAFGAVSLIDLPDAGADAVVGLHTGERLTLRREGDLGDDNAGVLVFPEDGEPTYVPWVDVRRIDLRHGAAPAPEPGSEDAVSEDAVSEDASSEVDRPRSR